MAGRSSAGHVVVVSYRLSPQCALEALSVLKGVTLFEAFVSMKKIPEGTLAIPLFGHGSDRMRQPVVSPASLAVFGGTTLLF